MSIKYDFYEKELNYKVKKMRIKIKNKDNGKINLLEWFLNSDFLIAREWWINNVEIVLKGKVIELIERGEIVELVIGKNITILNFIQHETFNLEIKDLFENINQLEVTTKVKTDELYEVMLEWDKILSEN